MAKSRLTWMLLFGLAGFGLNLWRVEVIPRIGFHFGGALGLLPGLLFGPAFGLGTLVVVGIPLLALWSDLIGVVCGVTQGTLVCYLVHRKRMQTALAAAVSWFLAALPIIFLFWIMDRRMGNAYFVLTLARVAVNSVTNALVADMIVHTRWAQRRFAGRLIPSRPLETYFSHLFCPAIALTLLAVILIAGGIQTRTTIASLYSTSQRAAMHIDRAMTRNVNQLVAEMNVLAQALGEDLNDWTGSAAEINGLGDLATTAKLRQVSFVPAGARELDVAFDKDVKNLVIAVPVPMPPSQDSATTQLPGVDTSSPNVGSQLPSDSPAGSLVAWLPYETLLQEAVAASGFDGVFLWAREDGAQEPETREEPLGEETHDKEAPGEETRDKEAPGEETRDIEAAGEETRDEGARGEEARGVEARGEEARGEEARGEARGEAREDEQSGGLAWIVSHGEGREWKGFEADERLYPTFRVGSLTMGGTLYVQHDFWRTFEQEYGRDGKFVLAVALITIPLFLTPFLSRQAAVPMSGLARLFSEFSSEPFLADLLPPRGDRIDEVRHLTAQFQHAAARSRTLKERVRESREALLQALMATLEARDAETAGHSRRVVYFTLKLAEELDVDPEWWDHIRWGALLHDIGKIAVPDAILQKNGYLDANEWKIMRTHCEVGYQIVSQISSLKPAIEVVRFHHERWDGTGYPFGLARDSIPLPARIFSVVDALDAMTSSRVYRPVPLSFEQALAEIKELSGTQFDPEVVDAALRIGAAAWEDLSKRASMGDTAGLVRLLSADEAMRPSKAASHFASLS